MIQCQCPNCKQRLNVPPAATGRLLTCPKCRGQFRLGGQPQDDQPVPLDKTQKLVLILVSLFTINVLIFSATAIFGSLGFAIFLLVVLIIAEAAIWNYKLVLKYSGQLIAHFNEQRQRKRQAALQNSLVTDAEVVQDSTNDRPPPSKYEHRSEFSYETVQREVPSRRRSESIPQRRRSRQREKQVRNIGDLPPSPRFLQANERLDLGFGEVVAPLVYATAASQRGRFDASLIDGSLPVTSTVSAFCDQLPYWPDYFDATPAQRKIYLDWLLGGRSDPNIELGYVFIYFYGLERRVIVDQKDLDVIADELIRLIPIYGTSNSFRGYASRLLWTANYLASNNGVVSNKRLPDSIDVTSRWTEDLSELLMGTLFKCGKPLTSEFAAIVARNDHRSSNSVIVKRHNDRFMQLFAAKFDSEFPDGLELQASKRASALNYHPASSSLLRDRGWESRFPKLPGVLRISSQFKPLVRIWDQCIDELKTYNRLHRKADGEMTAEVYESLPPELREDDHPEYDSWMQLWEKHADNEGWPLVPVSELAKLKSIDERTRLTKSQSQRIVRTAGAIGLGVEPDVDISGKNYGWNEQVCLFFEDPEATRNIKAYKSATILLRLGMRIAGADGEFDTAELEFIDQHLESTFNLSDADSRRLECLTYLLAKSPDSNFSITKSLCQKLAKSDRSLVGEFLVGIAAADGVLHKAEMKELKKAYRSLELETAELDQLLGRFSTRQPSATPGAAAHVEDFELDMNAIAEIMTETRQVSKLLEEAMEFAEPDEANQPIESTKQKAQPDDTVTAIAHRPDVAEESVSSPHFQGLAPRYHQFLTKVLTKTTWSADELDELARQNGQMLSGAVEAINEWSYEQFEDWLIEEGSEYLIHTEMLKVNR